MLLFVYEFITGGGLWQCAADEPGWSELRCEGRAMLSALVADLTAAGVSVVTQQDARFPFELPGRTRQVASAQEERETFEALVRESTGTLLIAPESSGVLRERAQRVEQLGGRLFSPGSSYVELTSDKFRTGEYLRSHGIPVPQTRLLSLREPLPLDHPYPAVAKPRSQAGALGVQWLRDAQAPLERSQFGDGWILQPWIAGRAASVAALCGPAGSYLLPAASQRIEGEGQWEYRGGLVPVAPPWQERARRLGEAVFQALPPAVGYVGIDLVLGATPAEDVVLEVNPRLTTSYVGLRHLARDNLARAMLDWAEGRRVPVEFRPTEVSFHPDGQTWELPEGGGAATSSFPSSTERRPVR